MFPITRPTLFKPESKLFMPFWGNLAVSLEKSFPTYPILDGHVTGISQNNNKKQRYFCLYIHSHCFFLNYMAVAHSADVAWYLSDPDFTIIVYNACSLKEIRFLFTLRHMNNKLK